MSPTIAIAPGGGFFTGARSTPTTRPPAPAAATRIASHPPGAHPKSTIRAPLLTKRLRAIISSILNAARDGNPIARALR